MKLWNRERGRLLRAVWGLALGLCLAGTAEGDQRRALLIGIDDYLGARPPGAATGKVTGRAEWHNLQGAVNDVWALREVLLAHYRFRPEEILLLTDQAASRRAILEAVERHLLAPAQRGDEVLFYFSGHGSQRINSLSDELDHRDETLVPADSRAGADDIRDKELRRLFNRLLDREVRLTVIFDSCHSGSKGRGMPPGSMARVLPRDPRDVADSSPAGPRPEDRGALVFSAAQDFELAYEERDERGQMRGAFSLALLQAIAGGGEDDSADELFLRARARLQAAAARQEPVLAGPAERRATPLFGAARAGHAAGGVVAVQRLEADGTVLLEGGWASGLAEGSELEPAIEEAGCQPRLRVTQVEGPAASRALIVGESRQPLAVALAPGALFRVVQWRMASAPSLRLWVPTASEPWETLSASASQLERVTLARGWVWVEDPVAQTPTHVLRPEGDGWKLVEPAGRVRALGPRLTAERVTRELTLAPPPIRLFFHLPAPQGLAAIDLGADADHSAIARMPGPEGADYFLVGRQVGSRIAFAWIRPGAGAGDQGRLAVPPRSEWWRWPAPETAAALEQDALRLAKTLAWLRLPSPPGGGFPYHLALRSGEGTERQTSGKLAGGSQHGLLLWAQPAEIVSSPLPRYIYVFVLDSWGKSTLLFPPPTIGSTENHFPLAHEGHGAPPAEIVLEPQPCLEVTEPYGIDTYFYLTTTQPLSNPAVLAFPGVRQRGPGGATSLERLLADWVSSERGQPWFETPASWSLERLTFETVAP